MSLTNSAVHEGDESWLATMRTQLRRSFVLGLVGYLLVVVIVVGALFTLLDSVKSAKSQLDQVTSQLQEARTNLDTTKDQFARLQEQYNMVLAKKDEAEKTVAARQVEIEALRKQLSQIYDFKPHVVPVSEIDEKLAYGNVGPKGFKILQQAIQDSRRKLPFNGANSPNAGFTSPGYAAYLLSMIDVHQRIDGMPRRNGPPQNGDIVVYGAGYTMFYFRTQPNKEFVIGMTPEGVLALDPKFSPPLAVVQAYAPG